MTDSNPTPETRFERKPALAGRLIGRYRLLRELGHGGQGFVYLAEDEKLHRQVALKILSGVMALTPGARLRFEREAEVAGKLDHPGIARVYEAGEEDGVHFIAMELVGGRTLAEHVLGAEETINLVTCPRLLRQSLCQGSALSASPVSAVVSGSSGRRSGAKPR